MSTKKQVPFEKVKIGSNFTYDGEEFTKYPYKENDKGKLIGIAWSIKFDEVPEGKPYKLWCFDNDTMVNIK